jgi:hypothetical protein
MTIADQIDSSASDDAYKNYLRAREAVKAMREVPLDRAPEFAWLANDLAEEPSKFAYLFDAAPATIAKLRHHCHLVGGASAESCQKAGENKPLYENKLKSLRSLDTSDLFVPESRALGGFGYEVDEGLVNLDTLKIYECMLAMDSGGAFAGLRRLPKRQLVLDIGGGWGGLAYALKRLFPRTCFVLCDFPEPLLVSATYLQTVFPSAKIAFVTSEDTRIKKWAAHDFIFVPHALCETIKPERIDLVTSSGFSWAARDGMMQAYVRLAASKRCPIVYSLCPKTSSDARLAVEQFYWSSEIPMLILPFTELGDGQELIESAVAERWRELKDARDDSEAPDKVNRAGFGYEHIVGWKRLG